MEHPKISQHITFIYTQNLEQAAHFYEEIFALQLWRDQKTCRIYHLTGESYLGICQRGDDAKGTVNEGQQNNVIITIVCDEVDQWYTFLTTKGIVFDKPPALNPRYNIYHCFLRDIDGYLIEIQRFLDPPLT